LFLLPLLLRPRSRSPRRRRRAPQQVVLTKNVPNLGEPGLLTSVRVGYFRNYLLPQGYAKLADEGILAAIKVKREAEEAAARKARSPKSSALARARRWPARAARACRLRAAARACRDRATGHGGGSDAPACCRVDPVR
jgi:hypothetical protein